MSLYELVFIAKQEVSSVRTKELAKKINDFIKDSESLLLEIGFLYEHTAQARMAKIRAFLQRAEVRPEEVSLIRGVLRQMRWAINKKNS